MRCSTATVGVLAIAGGMFLTSVGHITFGRSWPTIDAAARTGSAAIVGQIVSTDVTANSYGIEDAANDAGASARSIGPDLIIGELPSVMRWGRVGEITAYSVGTFPCNIGDERVSWVARTNQHPVWVQNMYRLKDDRFEQIGMSWAVHAFLAISGSLCGPCNDPTDGRQLGVGCSSCCDGGTYMNGVQGNMSRRSDVDAHTGYFPYPWTAPPPEAVIGKRIQVHNADLDPDLNDGASYFLEGQFIAADDAAAGNGSNNASSRRAVVTHGGECDGGGRNGLPCTEDRYCWVCIGGEDAGYRCVSDFECRDGRCSTEAVCDLDAPHALDFEVVGASQREQPAIRAWQDIDPSVVETDVQVPDEGLFIVAAKASDLGDGFWHYEYAVYNLNSDRSAGSFTVPLPLGASVRDIGFHDIDYHSGEIYDPTDWDVTVEDGSITWATQYYNDDPNANALRFSTLYNFWFDTNVPPASTEAVIGLFKPGSPSEVAATTIGPSLPVVDCNENGIEDICDIACGAGCVEPCGGSDDCNDNLVPDECDPDLNGNGIPDDCETIGPDVILGDVDGQKRWGRVGEITAFSVGTPACNVGDERVSWVAYTNQHPVWVQNMYRLKDGRFQQIGMSWASHGFYTSNETLCGPCNDPTNGTELGVGCSGCCCSAYMNGTQGNMSMRSDIDAYMGDFPYPWSAPEPEEIIGKRIQVHDADLDPDLNEGALYFAEGHYIAADDAAAGNGQNNVSHRGSVVTVDPELPGLFDMELTDQTLRKLPAIRAWQDTDPSVVETDVQVPDEGLFIIAAKASDLGDGYWHYEYAVFNLNSDRSAGSFTVPLSFGASVRDIGFHDVDYHSGEIYDLTDWDVTVKDGSITWATQDYNDNPNANALRFSTLYNFWFDANAGPDTTRVTLGLFKPGVPAEVAVKTVGPVQMVDCNGNGIEDICDIACGPGCIEPCGGSDDCNDNLIPDECEPDCNENGVADECDLGTCPPGELWCADCNDNLVPDECDPDLNGNGIPDDCESIGPDVIIGDLQSVRRSGRVGDIIAYSAGIHPCNVGNERVGYLAATNEHPVCVQGMYRFKDDRLEQIGMSWVWHAFYAVSQSLCSPCNDPTNGSELGVGCSSPESAYLLGVQGNMSLRSGVNAYTGYFPYPWSAPEPEETIGKRIQVHSADLDPDLNEGASYFVEAHYIAPDDAAVGNGNNNASYRPVVIAQFPEDTYDAHVAGVTQRRKPAIRAWKEIDPSVVETDVQVPGEGLFIVAAKASDLGDGYWHYEYAVYNLNSDRSAGSFTVPLPLSGFVHNIGFRDVDYHSGEIYDLTDWDVAVEDESITWATEDYDDDPNANALRFSTLYNFRFEIHAPPVPAESVIGLFKPGSPSEVGAMTIGPSSESIDCNENGVWDYCDVTCGGECEPPCGHSDDCNDNMIPDECEPDCNENDVADECDIADCLPNELWCADCNGNNIPDECDPDCDGDGIPDDCDTWDDADGDGIPDCFDLCPYTTPAGACMCPPTGWCCWDDVSLCLPNYPHDVCLLQGGTSDCVETPCRHGCLIGDYDADGDRDLWDCGALQRCFSGPWNEFDFVPPTSECLLRFDFDGDDDVDLDDYQAFHDSLDRM